MKRATKATIWLLGSLVTLILLASGAAWWLLNTERGLAVVRERLIRALRSQVNGSVVIGEIAGRGLLRGVVVRRFEIRDESGRPFLLVDSARASYDWKNLARLDIIVDDLTVYGATVEIERLPGDSVWNYQRIFADTTPPDGQRVQVATRPVRVGEVEVINGTAIVRRPWEPGAGGLLGDAERAILEEAEDGTVQTLRFESIDAEVGPLIWQSPAEPGKRIEVRALETNAFLFHDPVRLASGRGTVMHADSTLRLDLPHLTVGRSAAGAVGTIVLADEIGYDLQIHADEMRSLDMRWLVPRLPDDATASGEFTLVSNERGGVIARTPAFTLKAPGTNVSGSFGVETGAVLAFRDVDLTVAPLDLEWFGTLLPDGLPLDHLVTGQVSVSGPLSAARTSGNVRLRRAGELGSPVQWSGTLDMRAPARASAFALQSTGFDLGLLADWQPSLANAGIVAADLILDGSFDTAGMGIAGEARLLGPHAGTTDAGRVSADGRVYRTVAAQTELDLTLEARSLPLRELHRVNDRFANLGGVANGTVRLLGPTNALTFQADLAAAGGRLAFQGRVDGSGAAPRVAGSGSFTNVLLERLHQGVPEGTASARFAIDLQGSDLRTMRGPLRLQIDSARVRGTRVDEGLIVARLDSGIARVDSLQAVVVSARLQGNGEFGLVAERPGALQLNLRTPRLEDLERPLFGEIEDPLEPRLRGTLDLDATVRGSLATVDIEALARIEDAGFEQIGAGTATARIAGFAITSDSARIDIDSRAYQLRPFGWALDSAHVTGAWRRGQSDVQLAGWTGAAAVIEARAGITMAADQPPEVHVEELAAGTGTETWTMTQPIAFTVGREGMRVDSLRLRRADGLGAAVIDGALSWQLGEGSTVAASRVAQDFTVAVQGIPMPDMLRLVRLGEAGPASSGLVNGRVHVTGLAGAPVIDGALQVDSLRYGDLSLDRVTGSIAYADRNVAGSAEAFNGGRVVAHADAQVPYDLRFVSVEDRRGSTAIAIDILADSLPIAMGVGMFDAFRDVSGVADGRISIAGTLANPVTSGSLAIRRGAATLDALGVRYENVAGTIVLNDENTAIIDVAMATVSPRDRSRRGTAIVEGSLDLTELTDPVFVDINIVGQRMLAARRRDVDVTASGTLNLTGRYTRPVVTGNLEMTNSTLYVDELYRRYQVVELEERFLFQAIDTSVVAVRTLLPASENPFLQNLLVSGVDITVGADSRLQGQELDVEVSGNLNVAFDRQQEDLRLTGVLNTVRGTYAFQRPGIFRVFQIRQGGMIEFAGTPGIDPNLNIEAGYRARTQSEPLEIIARLTGTLQAPRLNLTSDREPPISESDLYSYLLFGAPTYAFNLSTIGGLGPNQGQLGGFGRGLEAVFSAYGFGYFTSGLQSVAQSTGIVDYIGLNAARSGAVSGEQGIGGILAGTEIEVGRYMTPSLYAAFSQRLRAPTRTPSVRLEWRFHPTYSMEMFAEDRFAHSPGFGLTEAIEARKVYGFLIFRQWGY